MSPETVFLCVLSLGFALVPSWWLEKAPDAFKDFNKNVQEYVKLHKAQESTLPALKTSDNPGMIAGRQEALAQKIQQARPQARAGDIFTPEAKEAFHRIIRHEFHGPHAPHARTTLAEGSPVGEVHLRVNQTYPATLPNNTFPPTLLLRFPRLPDQLAYRIVGRDLVLLDVKANLVVDVISDAIP